MAQKDVGNKVPIYKLKKTDEVMKYYDEWGEGNKYDQDMVDWNYTGPKETSEVFAKHQKNKDIKIYDAGCGTGLVGVELKKYGFSRILGPLWGGRNLPREQGRRRKGPRERKRVAAALLCQQRKVVRRAASEVLGRQFASSNSGAQPVSKRRVRGKAHADRYPTVQRAA